SVGMGDDDLFEAAGGHVVVELDPRIAPEVAGDELGDRLADDKAHGLHLVAPDEGTEGRLDPAEGAVDRLPLGGTDRLRVVEPLAEDPVVAPLDLVELEALPEPLVEVAQIVDLLRAQAEGLSHRLGGSNDALARPAVECGELNARQRFSEPFGQLGDFRPASFAQRDIEYALEAILLVIGGRAGPDQDHLGHSWESDPAVGAGAATSLAPAARANGQLGQGCRVI